MCFAKFKFSNLGLSCKFKKKKLSIIIFNRYILYLNVNIHQYITISSIIRITTSSYMTVTIGFL